MNGDVRVDEYWLDCEFCLEFDTGPIQTRTRACEVGEGHAIEPCERPFALEMQLDDGWVKAWDRRDDTSRRAAILISPSATDALCGAIIFRKPASSNVTSMKASGRRERPRERQPHRAGHCMRRNSL